MFLRIRCFENSNFRPACFSAVAVLGTVVLPGVIQAREIVPSIRPIVALNEPKAQLDSFMLLFDAPAAAGSVERNAFKHQFFEQKNVDADGAVPPPPRPAAGAASPAAETPAEAAPASANSSAEQSTDTSNAAAKPDPNFDRWQKDANDRLKEENAVKDPDPHPLAAANPGKNVVVCEAGCRTTKDEIVYIAAVVRSDVTDKKFEPSSANKDDGSVPCVAGCYDRDEPKRPVSRQRAEIAHPFRVAAKDGADEIVSHVVTEHTPKIKLHDRIASKIAPKGHRAQFGRNGAIVESRRLSRSAELLRRTQAKSSVLHGKKVASSWRAHITRDATQHQRRHSSNGFGQGARRMSGHAQGWKAFVHIGSR
jgi:hypothetical protein